MTRMVLKNRHKNDQTLHSLLNQALADSALQSHHNPRLTKTQFKPQCTPSPKSRATATEAGWNRRRTSSWQKSTAQRRVSNFFVVTKVKQGKTKKRLILDLKKSRVSRRPQKTHGVVPPRPSVLLRDVLELLSRPHSRTTESKFLISNSRTHSGRSPLSPRESTPLDLSEKGSGSI